MKTSSKTSVSADHATYAALAAQLRGYAVDLQRGIVHVRIAAQSLSLLQAHMPAKHYAVSTSRHGPGCAQGSYRTPVGLHRIEAMIGDGQPPGTVFRGRRVAVDDDPGYDDQGYDDPITSRIMWLGGLEAGKNLGAGCDSQARYIYIHGTPHEDRIGQPASIGCIRMRDRDVIDLFARVRQNTPVVIEP